jgi:hypothetical protein
VFSIPISSCHQAGGNLLAGAAPSERLETSDGVISYLASNEATAPSTASGEESVRRRDPDVEITGEGLRARNSLSRDPVY